MVTAGTCYGTFIYKGIDPGKRAPFYGFIAPMDKVSPDEIAEGFHELFDRIIRTDKFNEAVTALRGGTDGTPPPLPTNTARRRFGSYSIPWAPLCAT